MLFDETFNYPDGTLESGGWTIAGLFGFDAPVPVDAHAAAWEKQPFASAINLTGAISLNQQHPFSLVIYLQTQPQHNLANSLELYIGDPANDCFGIAPNTTGPGFGDLKFDCDFTSPDGQHRLAQEILLGDGQDHTLRLDYDGAGTAHVYMDDVEFHIFDGIPNPFTGIVVPPALPSSVSIFCGNAALAPSCRMRLTRITITQ